MAAAASVFVVVPFAGSAMADDPQPMPSQQQVRAAQDDVAQKKSSVTELESELGAAQTRSAETAQRAEVASEAYNGARWRLSVARKKTRAAHAALERARAQVADQRGDIAQLVVESYQNGTQLTTADAVIGEDGPEGVMSQYGVVGSARDSMEAKYRAFRVVMRQAHTAEHSARRAQSQQADLADEARTARDEAASAAVSAQSEADQIATRREAVVQALAQAQDISVQLAQRRQHGLELQAQKRAEELAAQQAAAQQAAQEAAQQAAQQAAAAAVQQAAEAKAKAQSQAEAKQHQAEVQQAADAAAKAKAAAAAAAESTASQQAEQTKTARASTTGSGDPGEPAATTITSQPIDETPPAPSHGADAAISYAKAQLGKPYVWGAAGPSSFDCSGLTMRAWQQGGISLPHYSAAQYAESTRISMGDLRPGDLVFWGSSPSRIHHVALYVGDGEIIQAPHTGDVVKLSSIYNPGTPTYFARP